MKKFILSLITFALALTSCNLDEQFTATNVTELVTVYSNTLLIRDDGTSFTITQDETDHQWQKGDRLIILFDVLNRSYDIVLKNYAKCTIYVPTLAGEEPQLGEDPVILGTGTISGGYVNVEISYYRKKGSDFLHTIDMEYMDDSETLSLFLIYQGNGEDPSKMDKNDLEKVTVPYCFQISNLVKQGETRKLAISLVTLNAKDEVMEQRYWLYDAPYRF